MDNPFEKKPVEIIVEQMNLNLTKMDSIINDLKDIKLLIDRIDSQHDKSHIPIPKSKGWFYN